MYSFDDILDKVFQACESLDDSQIVEALNNLMAEEDLNNEERKFLMETFELLDSSAEKYEDLQVAKDDCVGRQEWLAKQFDSMLEGRTEEEVITVMKAVGEATDNQVKEELTNEEE